MQTEEKKSFWVCIRVDFRHVIFNVWCSALQYTRDILIFEFELLSLVIEISKVNFYAGPDRLVHPHHFVPMNKSARLSQSQSQTFIIYIFIFFNYLLFRDHDKRNNYFK